MKKITFAIIAFAAMLIASCGGNKAPQATDEVDTTKTFEQEQIEAAIKMHIDSLVEAMGEKEYTPLIDRIKNGDIKLTDEELKVKPDYLLAPETANDMTTYAQKYAALVMLAFDKSVADLYKMDTAGYDEAIGKLASDINDPAYEIAIKSEGKNFAQVSKEMYKADDEAGRINFYWIGTSAATVESLYIMSQNVEKFAGNYTDEQIANITFRLFCAIDALDRLSVYDAQVVGIAEGLQPLKNLNATTMDEFKKQLEESKASIKVSREAFLK